ncbi:pleckstrin homology domain-containing family M member 1-like isoform X2 [Mizuhopecten yessoensis]|uniref:pleckstrin homology domain-containing family M member 1-like isoform X2 n=1 Tax=Mizuhopecten yessoensis TaxID=6573 RepID=UPI000B45E9E6|nr:pleckstrin homology domain-containing family M member 1-like isoform X2 [Mizuhopecten yessoensis]
MSLFRKRGPTSEDVARENQVKRAITKELSSSIRTLQREHHRKDEVITSTDQANAVCNILEAIFLHNLKNSVSKKFANYMGLSQTGENGDISINFWQFAVKFTHGDVIAQLKRLGQVTTEIGLCRAWIRMALNDCLMESYVDAMLADKKTLEMFYHRTAYLRDHEQPEIFKSYLKGLMSLEFKLSYNSRVLNSWSKSPLILAGLLQPDNTPLPVMSTEQKDSSPDEKYYDGAVANGHDVVDIRSVRTRSRGSSSEGDPTGRSSKGHKVKKSQKNFPNSSDDSDNKTIVLSSELTRSDVEKIRNMPRTASSQDTGMSECSSSSHVSCPDPVNYNKSPASYVENEKENMFSLTDDNEIVATQEIETSTSEVLTQKTEMAPKFKIGNSPEMDFSNNDALNARILDDILNASDGESSNIAATDYFQQSGLPDLSMTSLNVENSPASKSSLSSTPDFDRVSVSPKSQKETETTKKSYKVKGKMRRLKPDLSPPQKSAAAPELSSAVAVGIETTGSMSRRGRLSMPDICAVITRTEPRNRLGVIDARSEPDIPGQLNDNEDNDNDSHVGSPYVGNSLGAMSGWSSSFDLEAQDTVQPLRGPSVSETVTIGRPKSESFGSLLQNYTPSSSAMTSPSLDDVLQDLPDIHKASPSKHDIHAEQNMENRLALLGEIACEKGLDAQNYKCGGCSRPVGLIYGNPRLCTFDGMYYCFECHENDEYYIPAFIIHNWDFRKHKVAKRNLSFLQDSEDQAFINIAEVNSKLYEHVKEMEEIQLSRVQLTYLKTYLFTCKQSIAEEFRKSVWPKDYLYDTTEAYSLSDLLQVPSGQLQQSLKKVIKFASKHVYDCRLCSQKGFICELCSSPKVIYPFEVALTVRCHRCKSVFHKSCKTESRQCPKCQRRDSRKSLGHIEPQTPDIHDYAYSPHR